MEEPRRPRERELVLSPNEYAYILDSTKGHINCYVGPNKTSLAQTDELVVFNALTKRFDRVNEMSHAVMLFATAPAGWYLVLKNPSHDDKQPGRGMASPSADLDIGRKVVVEGPSSFPLWPGQMVRIIQGHRLRSNQYLVVRAYDAAAVNRTHAEDEPWGQGEKRIIRGTDTSFYIPPTGIEVVADESATYVRNAVTLHRLEYCVLIGEDGTKVYVRGEAVVFPSPHQRFLMRQSKRNFRAVELSETTGLYVKVIAPYTDRDADTGEERTYREGEELFLTGENKVYFPRQEHAIIRHGDSERHHAVAIPSGEGRYLLDRKSGEVRLCAGPRMLLPDPRREVLVRRVLDPREARLLFPGRPEGRVTPAPEPADLARGPRRAPSPFAPKSGSDGFDRGSFEAPRTITLASDAGAVRIDISTGYAVQLKRRSGARRVVQGPASALLEYDETVDALTLSTGRPKTNERILETAALQLCGNKVSDEVDVYTQDLVRARVTLKYRVNFEGEEPARWFMVDNYVQLLCDHASSKVKAAARKRTIAQLRGEVTDLVRDALLGTKPDAGEREGLRFAENAMRVYDVEVLDLEVLDAAVAELLASAQFQSVNQSIKVTQKESLLEAHRRTEEIERVLAAERHETERLRLKLADDKAAHQHQSEQAAQQHLAALTELERARELRDASLLNDIRTQRVQTELAVHNVQLQRRSDVQALELTRLRAEVESTVQQATAFSPHLVSALHRLGDETMIAALSENFSELAAVEGRGLLATAQKFLDFVPASMVPQLRGGDGVPPETPRVPVDDPADG